MKTDTAREHFKEDVDIVDQELLEELALLLVLFDLVLLSTAKQILDRAQLITIRLLPPRGMASTSQAQVR